VADFPSGRIELGILAMVSKGYVEIPEDGERHSSATGCPLRAFAKPPSIGTVVG